MAQTRQPQLQVPAPSDVRYIPIFFYPHVIVRPVILILTPSYMGRKTIAAQESKLTNAIVFLNLAFDLHPIRWSRVRKQ